MKQLSIKSTLITTLLLIGTSVFAETNIAICSIEKNRKPLNTVYIQEFELPSEEDFPLHATTLFTIGDIHYTLWVPFSNNLSKVSLSFGHSQSGGVASDVIIQGDLNLSNLKASDLRTGIDISCQKL